MKHRFLEAYIGWCKGTAAVSDKICKYDGGAFSHVYYKFVTPGGLALIYESLFKGGVQITPYNHFLRAKAAGKVAYYYERPLDIGPVIIDALWNRIEGDHKEGYDGKRITGYFMWKAFRSKDDSPLLNLHNPDEWTCNELVVDNGAGLLPELPTKDFRLGPEGLYKRFNGSDSNAIDWSPNEERKTA